MRCGICDNSLILKPDRKLLSRAGGDLWAGKLRQLKGCGGTVRSQKSFKNSPASQEETNGSKDGLEKEGEAAMQVKTGQERADFQMCWVSGRYLDFQCFSSCRAGLCGAGLVSPNSLVSKNSFVFVQSIPFLHWANTGHFLFLNKNILC